MLDRLTQAALLALIEMEQMATDTPAETNTTEVNSSYPGDSCCRLYDYDFFAQTYQTFCLDDATKSQSWDMNDYGWDGRPASFACGQNVSYQMCENWADDCDYRRTGTGAGNIKNPYMIPHDKLTWMTLHPYDVLSQGAVTIFSNFDCKDNFAALFAPESETVKAEYTRDDVDRIGVKCDDMSSMMIPFGYAIDLYDYDGFGGEVRTHVGQPFLDSNHQMECTPVDSDFDNRACSYKVYKTRQLGTSRGYWTSLTATENIDFTVHYGMQIQSTTSTKSTEEYTLNYEMSMGMEFEGLTSSKTLSSGFAQTIEHDTTDMYTQDISFDWHITCTGGDGKSGVGLWQYITETNDSMTKVLTKHTVCRYGDDYNQMPACPWNACTNGDCTECAGGWYE